MEKIPFEKEGLLPVIQELGQAKHGTTVKSLKSVGGGGFGLVYELVYDDGKAEILKAFKVGDMLQAEAAALRLLRQASPLKVPEVYYTHGADDKFPVNAMAMERIDGVSAQDLPFFLSAKKRRLISETVISALAKIHETTADKYGYVDGTESFDTWQEFYKAVLFDVYERAKPFCKENVSPLNDKIIAVLEIGIKNIDYILADKVKKPSLLHGDLWIANIMVDAKTFEPTGILDPLHSMWGDKEFDLFPLNAPWGRRFKLYETYKKRYETSARVDLKTAFYYFVNEVLCRLQSGSWSGGGGNSFYKLLIKCLENEYQKHGIK
ncbi:MAG: fructosamine kinase family protein [Clostridiaceae bacterium]|jgi:fructosamine-3-kinase|nr:fructosamine kinase family protein [Clostridiaceae bacterium]